MLSRAEYRGYIASREWTQKKDEYARSKMQKSCWCCGAHDVLLDTHHLTYKRLGKERLTDLRKVCRHCHKGIHNLARRKGWTLWGATTAWKRRMQRRLKRTTCKAQRYRRQ
jgi:hypothetical protein